MSGDEIINVLKGHHRPSGSKTGINRTSTMPMGNTPDSRSGLRKTSLVTAGQRTFQKGIGVVEDVRS